MSEPETEQDITEQEVAELDAEGAPEEAAGEDDGADQLEGEPDAPAEASSLQVMEERGKKLDQLTKHVARRMGEILGDEVTLFEECEWCSYSNTPGWRLTGPPPSAVEDLLRVAMGDHALAEYKPDEYSRACERCNGLGVVLTGSKVEGQNTLSCLACKGMGWVPIGNERATGAFATVNGPTAAPPPTLAGVGAGTTDTPEIIAARALLQEHGHMVIPMTTVG